MYLMPILVIAFLSSVVMGAGVTYWVREISNERGWARGPISERHLHEAPVPRTGGIAIFITLGICTAACLFFLPRIEVPYFKTLLGTVIAGSLVFGVGLADDFREVSPRTKILVEILAATVLYVVGIQFVHSSGIFGIFHSSALVSYVATVGWVLLITNAFNLIDGLDGLAGGIALFSSFTLLVVSLISHEVIVSVVAVVLTGSLIGVLRYNFNPASIFLGDGGSLFLGFTLATLSMMGAQKMPTLVSIGLPLFALGLPIIDVFVSIARRLIRGSNIFDSDEDHIHHRLLKRGLTHKSAVLVLYGASGAFGLLGLIMLYPRGPVIATMIIVAVVAVISGIRQLGYREFIEVGRLASSAVRSRNAISRNILLQRYLDYFKACETTDDFTAAMESLAKSSLFAAVALSFEVEEYQPFTFTWATSDDDPRNCLTITVPLRNGNGYLGELRIVNHSALPDFPVDLQYLTRDLASVLVSTVMRVQKSETRQGIAMRS
jgi:UDP-GlcNAc:undecaprenyl-phosphate/decaprenyl-phosphate GlcNAc-1-phosphate transferase